MSERKPIICLDFDGVIHSYDSGWKGPDVIVDPATPGFAEWAAEACKTFQLHVFSSRTHQHGGREAMAAWFVREFGTMEPFELPHFKPAALVSIDDRAVQFNGDWSAPEVQPEALAAFKPWNKR